MIFKFLLKRKINKYSKSYLIRVYFNIIRYPNNYDKDYKLCIIKRIQKEGLLRGTVK